MQPEATDIERVHRALGATTLAWRAASGHGAPSHRRFVVDLQGERSAFVKIAAFDYTAEWLREEFRVYAALDGQPFLPRLLGWDDDGLARRSSSRTSPERRGHRRGTPLASTPSWRPSRPCMRRRHPWPCVLPSRASSVWTAGRTWPPTLNPSFRSACARRDGFATICRPSRMRRPPPRSTEPRSCTSTCAATTCVCRTVGSSWSTGNNACVGNALLDLASWLPSLQAEGGPSPHAILPDETPGSPAIASLLAGYFCARAGLPAIPQAPHARPLQLMQSRTALPWAARALGLPPPA